MADGWQPPQFSQWTDKNEERLAGLMPDNININYTYYGHDLALKEKEFKVVADNMSHEEIDALRWKLGMLK